MIVVQILSNLLFTLGVIFLTTPDFQFYDILFSQIVHNDICPFLVTSLCLNVVIARAVDNWSQVQQKQLSAILFLEFIWLTAIDVVEVEDKLLQNLLHIQLIALNKLIFVVDTLGIPPVK